MSTSGVPKEEQKLAHVLISINNLSRSAGVSDPAKLESGSPLAKS
jgi:hypothetical protein